MIALAALGSATALSSINMFSQVESSVANMAEDPKVKVNTACKSEDSEDEQNPAGSLGGRNKYNNNYQCNSNCRGCNCNLDPKDNGCLCYEYFASYVWFVPADKNGECRDGAHPVNTDHYEIYDWIAKWNIDGTKTVADQWTLSSSTNQGIVL